MLTKSMKSCRPCGRILPETEFHWRNKAQGVRISICKGCTSTKSKAHYQTNKPMYLRKTAKNTKRTREVVCAKILNYLKQHPCVDCGEADPIVLQFDHVRGQKAFNLGKATSKGFSWRRIEAEIQKCEVRCANCHTRKTARDFGWYKFLAREAPAEGLLHGTQV